MNLIILFSGQGLQSQAHVDEILSKMSSDEQSLLASVVPELFADPVDDSQLFENRLFDNQVAQPFIYTLQYYRWHRLQQMIGMPMAFSGYSLGEVSAFCCSSQLPYGTGLDLVHQRASVMQNAVSRSSGLMAIKGVPDRKMDELLAQSQTHLSIKINRDQFIIAGNHEHLEQAADIAQNLGAQNVQRLKVSVPSHTVMMQAAADAFGSYTQSLALPPMQIPIISATDGTRYSDSEQGLRILSQQVDHPLDWYLCLETLEEYQPNMVIEIGPGSALSKMVNNVMPHIPCRSWDDFRNIDGLQAWIDRNR
ncbi:malonate decarboxylase subunit epsilon [Psychrobacter proteolyticus]|uniref:malonate decarboxylase subunit epsilon n=1 Tax=Psychrobacter proteolyticus TaxID=147825 RepID=UPI003D04B011